MAIKWKINDQGKKEHFCVCGKVMKLHRAGAYVCTDPECWWVWDFAFGWSNGKEKVTTLNKWIPIQKTEYVKYIGGITVI